MVSLIKKLFNRGEVDCVETRELSSDYLDGDLSPQKSSAIQTHLSRCGPCRAFVDTLSSTIGMLTRFPRVSPRPGFKQSIIDRAKREQEEEGR